MQPIEGIETLRDVGAVIDWPAVELDPGMRCKGITLTDTDPQLSRHSPAPQEPPDEQRLPQARAIGRQVTTSDLDQAPYP